MLCVCSYEETEYPALSEYNSLMNYLNYHPIYLYLSQVGGRLEFHSEILSQTKQKYVSELLLQIKKKNNSTLLYLGKSLVQINWKAREASGIFCSIAQG